MLALTATFTFQSDGVNPVVLTLDGVAGGDAGRFAFNGFEIEELPKGTVICIR